MFCRGRQFANAFYCSLSNSTGGIVEVTVKELKKGSSLAEVSMNKPPVNSLNISFTRELSAALSKVEACPDVEALVIKSAISGQFSAGLDLSELYGRTPEQLKELWKSMQELWLQLYSSRLATVAYINGNCLAAGVILAAACDYRLAVEGHYRMGITAARVGMVAPFWGMELIAQTVGRRRAEYDLQTQYSPTKAEEVGFVDKFAQHFVKTILDVVRNYLSVSQLSRATMKKR